MANPFKQKGGKYDDAGYLLSNLHNFTPEKVIDSNHITTQGMAFPIVANGHVLYPNTGDFYIPGNKVREIPLHLAVQDDNIKAKLALGKGFVINRTYQWDLDKRDGDVPYQVGVKIPFGKRYQKGGFTRDDLFKFLMEEDEPTPSKPAPEQMTEPDEPSTEPQVEETPDSDYELALQVAMGDFGNPYSSTSEQQVSGNPYKGNGKESPNALATLQEFQPQGFTNLGIWPSQEHMMQNPNSDHNTGRALDLGVNDPTKGDAAVTKLQSEAKQKDIKYIIWNRRIWNPQTNTWKPYSGKDPHTTHIHISYNQ